MPRFQVTKQLRVVYTVEADDPQRALAAEPPGDAAVSILKERAKNLDHVAGAGRPVITARELRPGRRFVARYKKQEWLAEVLPDGQISLRKKGARTAQTFPTLAKAAMHIIDGKAVNCWMLFTDAEPASPAPTEPARARRRAHHEEEAEPQQPGEEDPAQ